MYSEGLTSLEAESQFMLLHVLQTNPLVTPEQVPDRYLPDAQLMFEHVLQGPEVAYWLALQKTQPALPWRTAPPLQVTLQALCHHLRSP